MKKIEIALEKNILASVTLLFWIAFILFYIGYKFGRFFFSF